MRRVIRVAPVVAIAALLGIVVPAIAQVRPGDPRQPVRTTSRLACVSAGTGVALLASDTTAAKIIGTPPRATSNPRTVADTPVITLDAPAGVGACGRVQAFWDDSVTGPVAASLQVLGADDTTALASDAYQESQTGPAIVTKDLRAVLMVDTPGTHNYVAVFTIRAGTSVNTVAQPPGAASDSVRVPFTVILRGQGMITGTVLDAGGAPIAGASVTAGTGVSGRGSIGAGRGVATVRTNDQGVYELPITTGKWWVQAQAPFFKAQWFSGKDNPGAADLVDVTAGATVSDVDFSLTPVPHATISGVVLRADGTPLANATVTAVCRSTQNTPCDRNSAGSRGSVSTTTDENGAYTLIVAPGSYAVGAAQPTSTRPGAAAPTQWWDHHAALDDADVLELADGAVQTGIDFDL